MKPHFSRAFDMLFAYAELLDDLAIALKVVLLQVVQVTAPLTDHLQKTSPRMIVVLVRLQVLRQMGDAAAQKRYLHFR
jgi:hypothetical protein